jgi:hypothetical protein
MRDKFGRFTKGHTLGFKKGHKLAKLGRIKECRLNLKTFIEFRAWLAGIIDGEGNFRITSSGGPQIRVVFTERDKFVLDYIVENIGGALYYRKPLKSWKDHWKPEWEWSITSFIDCKEFTKWILPYLVLKKETALRFLEDIK